VFNRLTEEDIRNIAKNLLTDLEKRMNAIEISMTFQESVVDFVAKAGYDKIYGARPLKRTIQSKIEDVLSEKILEKSIEKGKSYTCSCDENGDLVIE
jgi:ATP-dependent Clp protease ATP-binding subunit ClpC